MQKIAVIGLSCLFPGAHTPEQFITNLNRGIDSTLPHTKEQMGVEPAIFYSPGKGEPDKYYSKRGGYITGFEFDPTGFEWDEAILTQLDDIYQWSLYVAREALIHGGYFDDPEQRKNCGVILGNLSFPTKLSNQLYLPIYRQAIQTVARELLQSDSLKFKQASETATVHPYNGRISGFPSAVLSHALGLSQTFFALDAACASSLYSIKLACDYLNSGKADLMLAGAVSAGDPFFVNQGFSTFTAYSENDVSCPLDKRSEGLVSGEGAGMLLLKRYDDAIKDRDTVHAVISAIGLSNDGKGRSVLSPNAKGQLLAYERAYQRTDIRPDQIDYLECHATGTRVGDLIELESLDAFFGRNNASPLIGAVKANFGHLLTCAGMASIIKVIMSMSQSEIPATINLEQPVSSPHGVITGEQVVAVSRPWPKRSATRIGAVNAFGFGGTNAHLILQDTGSAAQTAKRSEKPSQPMAIIGMEACFGPFPNLQAFDHGLYAGKQGFVKLPEQRWKGLETDMALLSDYDIKTRSLPSGAYLDRFAFDTLRYRIPPNEIESMLPQQLLMLKVADQAVRDARLREGTNVAVIVAMESEKTLHQFRGRIDLDWLTDQVMHDAGIKLSTRDLAELKTALKDSVRHPVQVNEFTSFIGNIMASRIAALWDFSGPAFTISAEENSVYNALEVAQLMLDNEEVDAVVVGGVDLAGNFEDVLTRNRLKHPFAAGDVSLGLDDRTTGWKVGEGAGAVVLKSLDKAKRENHRRYATIDAIYLQKECTSESIGNALQKTLSEAQIPADEIGLFEISGVGKEEDVISGAHNVLRTLPEASCALGSAVATIGRTYAASGIASLIKSALCLHHCYIPSVPAWSGPNPSILPKLSSFYIPTESRYWASAVDAKRTAAIGGIGSDGSFANVLLREDPSPQKRSNHFFEQEELFMFPVVGADREEIDAALSSLKQQIAKADDLYRFACRHHAETTESWGNTYRAVIIGVDKEALDSEIDLAKAGIVNAFEKGVQWESDAGSYFTADPLANEENLALVYPGASGSYPGMGRDTFRLFPDLVDLMPIADRRAGMMLSDRLLYPRSLNARDVSDDRQGQDNLESAVAAQFESGMHFAILKSALLRGAFGIQAKSAFGYGTGEVFMGFALGLWTHLDPLIRHLHDSSLFAERLAGPMVAAREAWGLTKGSSAVGEKIWDSYLIRGPVAEIIKSLNGRERLYLLAIHTANEAVIGGHTEACRRYLQDVSFTAAPFGLPSIAHCPLAEKERQQLNEIHSGPVTPNSNMRLYSAATCQQTDQNSHQLAGNIADIYCKTLNFPKLVDQVYQDGSRIFLEIGPRNECTNWVNEILGSRDHLALSLDNQEIPEHQALFRALAKLYSHGVGIDLSAIYPVNEGLAAKTSRSMDITLGGKGLRRSILTPENRERFKQRHVAAAPSTAAILEAGPGRPAGPENPVTGDLMTWAEQEVTNHRSRINQAHAAFLNARQASLQHLREMIRLKLIFYANGSGSLIRDSSPKSDPFKGDPYFYPETRKPHSKTEVVWDETDLLEFAGGKISRVFGEAYEIIDTYRYRVRLPLPPYLLVNRVTKLDARRGEFKPSSLTTEYDIAEDAWFSVDGQIPWAIASEAGQCDLLLISYLGIDFQSKGIRYYRLIDYTMTFFDELPKAGQTLRYDIRIESFTRSGEALFFTFGYDCYVKDKLVYKMTGGRAGFISDKELAQGKGVVFSKAEQEERRAIGRQQFTPLLICKQVAFNRQELLNITQGNIAACLGAHYDQQGLNPSLRFAAEEMLMLDRIVNVDTHGGPWGLGEVIAEKDLAPDHWYFPCHFKDDNVLAGTLVTEGCVQLLGFYMLYLGLQVKTRDARFQPIKNRPYGIRARGQIVPTDTRFTYKMEIIEIGLQPRPFARANFYIIMNDKILVDFRDLGVELLEKSPTDPAYHGLAGQSERQPAPLFGPEVIEEFATGSLANVFGPAFEIYQNRRGPRMPNGDLKLVSRIMDLKGEPGNFRVPSELTAEFDVPASAWYFQQNSYPIMPYSIIMEIALQPCAFLSAYMETTLSYPEAEMCFRNLGSTAELAYTPDLRGKTIKNKIRMTSVFKAAETVVMNFSFELICEGHCFYKGITQFGYFTPKALNKQKGLDRGETTEPWFRANGLTKEDGIRIDLTAKASQERFYRPQAPKPWFCLAGDQLDFLDEAIVFVNQGRFEKGYIVAGKQVNAADWFYPYHFYNDPVMPGSLGVEAILQAMKLFALQQNLGAELKSPRFVHVPGVMKWLYRGQITPDDENMDLEVHIKSLERSRDQIVIKADANLWKNKLRIDQITDAAIAVIGEKE